MADLGLLMNDEMARACWEGRKTVTRRPMSGQPEHHYEHAPGGGVSWTRLNTTRGPMWRPAWFMGAAGGRVYDYSDQPRPARIPGAGIATVGQRVWIRESFWHARRCGYIDETCNYIPGPWSDIIHYGVGHASGLRDLGMPEIDSQHYYWNHRPSIHMPKWAARTWGELVSVTPCDLSTVDDAEAKREGFTDAAAFLSAIRGMYPDACWFWRLEWRRIPRPNGETR